VARVTTAIALSDDESARLRAALAGLYGRDVHLQLEIDADVVGGVVVQIGDEVLDGSIAGRLAQAGHALE
jgi:F-type H+-transporting ATPase subunit delta